MTATMMQWCGAVARRVLMTESTALMARSNSTAAAPILCGRGDKRTKRGKRFKGSYGNARPKKEKMIERIKDKVEVPRTQKELHLEWKHVDIQRTKLVDTEKYGSR
ncbi:30S ribosomal protein S31 [Quillaja saponaria]|uniref:30S ribosomal protein S31 n=1 Tax=Quillaja saponaria TaxID=32244 RepID=A0AAD7VJT2_QUISA|nr:30S ribosomal protein S31 [Quillaja saponaria]